MSMSAPSVKSSSSLCDDRTTLSEERSGESRPKASRPVESGDASSADRANRWAHPIRKAVMSVLVWLAYVPLLRSLRFLGPRFAEPGIIVVARLHWLLTFVGAQRRALQAMEYAQVHIESKQSSRQLLKQHLEFKYRSFATWQATLNPKADIYDRLFSGVVHDEEKQQFLELSRESRGIILISYHFGFFRQAAAVAPKICSQVKFCQIRNVESPYVKLASSSLAKLVREHKRKSDHDQSCDMVYLDDQFHPRQLVRRLRRNEVLIFAADGMMTRRFEDVPFLGGRISMPAGWARLAAATGAPVVVLMECASPDHAHREIRLRRVIRVDRSDPDAVRNAVIQATEVLETHIRKRPWEWHPWQRLRIERSRGTDRYHLVAGGQNEESHGSD